MRINFSLFDSTGTITATRKNIQVGHIARKKENGRVSHYEAVVYGELGSDLELRTVSKIFRSKTSAKGWIIRQKAVYDINLYENSTAFHI